jgi:OOP family OmpA-OmpF porin
MRLKGILLATIGSIAITGMAATSADAQTGWYVSLGAGLNWVGDESYKIFETGVLDSAGAFNFDDGYVVSAAVGRDFSSNWRVEFELALRDNDVDRRCWQSAGCLPADYRVREFSQMINVFRDVPIGGSWDAAVGVGIGGNQVTIDRFQNVQLDDYVFSAQAIAQVAYRVSPRWQVFADYRYVTNDDVTWSLANAPNDDLEISKDETSLQLGVRLHLGAAAPMAPALPAPVPVPAPPAPRQFLVFFGFDQSTLSEEAARVVAEAAAAAKQFGSTVISIVGHTDTSGSTAYNAALSLRRAQAVKDGLVAQGLGAAMISTNGRGELELMVLTGDGVKEPQNRRATIDLN